MRLSLVNPPSSFYDTQYLAPPIGLLTLAAVIKGHGYDVSVIDLNLEVIANRRLGISDSFYDLACKEIMDEQPHVVGFTSMCLESHVSLELARRLKEADPAVITLFGGTHFGAIAQETLRRFPFVDYVVQGEAEKALIAILEQLCERNRDLPRSVWYRQRGKILAGRTPEPAPSWEELNFPAYDLVNLKRYFALNPNYLLNYEAGRGCVFKCSFCYSPSHYGDAVRNKPPELVVKDLRELGALGARHIFFVQDNLLNSPQWAAELCRQLINAKLPLTWECYATHPQLNDELIGLLSQAGCVGIFIGIDAVPPASQKRMNKRFLKSWEDTRRKLVGCRENGILPICAFILEGPTQPIDQVDATIRTALECISLGCEIHLNTLTLYNSTELARSTETSDWCYSQIKPEFLFDTPKIVQENSFAREVPRLFPYHSTHFQIDDWEIFTVKVFTLWAALIAAHKSLYQYGIVENNSVWELVSYLDSQSVGTLRESSVSRRRLEALLLFAKHFLERPLSRESSGSFRRELARLILSTHETPRYVSLRVADDIHKYQLGWFLCTSGGLIPNHDIAIEMLLESHLASDTISLPTDRSSFKSVEIALRSNRSWVQVYVVNEVKLRLLSALNRASKSGKPLPVSPECVLQLMQEEWIWPVGEEPSASPLGTAEIAA